MATHLENAARRQAGMMRLHSDIEAACLWEFARLMLRSPRYAGLVLPMYARSVQMPRRAQVLRATYCLLRHIDDVLDGDRRVPGDPVCYALRLRRQGVADDAAARGLAGRLTRFVFEQVPRLARPGDDPVRTLLELIDAMLFDAERARTGRLLSRAALQRHHRRTFDSALDITLLIVGAHWRAAQLEPLVQAQTSLYALRDFDVDVTRGILNVPRDAWGHAARGVPAPAMLRRDARVRAWMRAELDVGLEALRRAEVQLRFCADRPTRFVVKPLVAGLGRIARRLAPAAARAPRITLQSADAATGRA